MRRLALVYAGPALVVTAGWLRVEGDASASAAVALACLALVPALLRLPWARAAAALGVSLLALSRAFDVSPLDARPFDGGRDFLGPLGSRLADGVLGFYDVSLPFAPAERPFMDGVVLVAVFGFCLALGLALAARRPLLASLVLVVGAAWPTTLVGDGELGFGAAILAGVLLVLTALQGDARPGRPYRQAVAAGAVLIVAALAGATSPAVAKGEFLSWKSWDPYDRPDDPVGVRYVWDASYRGIRFPKKRTTVLTVDGPAQRVYWRATTLDTFVSDRWIEALPTIESTARRSVVGSDGLVPQAGRDERLWLRSDVRIAALRDTHLVAPGMPVAWDPRGIGSVDLRAGGVAVLPAGLERDDAYTVYSYAPRPTPRQLAAAPALQPRRNTREAEYLELAPGVRVLPFGTPGRGAELDGLLSDSRYAARLGRYRPLYDQARRVTGAAPSPYAATVALETWFRSRGGFTYDEQPSPDPGQPPLVSFVTDAREGYCQYYAGAMALMLRSLGIPAQVAVGFTSGTYDAKRRRWTVTDHDAHAWVEVWFEGWGWLPFDPTPGRGRLSGTYTSASAAVGATAAIANILRRIGGDEAGGTTGQLVPRRVGDGNPFRGDAPGDLAAAPSRQREAGASLVRLLGLLAGALVLAIVGAKRLRRARRLLARDPRRLAGGLRRELVDFLVDQRLAVDGSATLRELGRSVERELSVDAGAFVRAASAARFAPPTRADEAARRARGELQTLRRRLGSRLGPGRRLRGLLSVRSLGLDG